MTIQLPEELESSIQAVVHTGRFTSVNDAMAAAARLLLREIEQEQAEPVRAVPNPTPDPLLGIWRDIPDEIDKIVADAYRNRQEDRWRPIPTE